MNGEFSLAESSPQLRLLKVAIILMGRLLTLGPFVDRIWFRSGLRQYRDMQMDKGKCSESRTGATGSEARRNARCEWKDGQGMLSQSVEGPRRDPTVQG